MAVGAGTVPSIASAQRVMDAGATFLVAPHLDLDVVNSRGASTITQQLVRARLLDAGLVQDTDRTFERKLKEIVQSIRVTEQFQGEAGKREIITAYLN